MKSIIRVLCEPHQYVRMITIKSNSKCTMMMRDISKVCPYIRQIFVYRNRRETLISFLAIIMSEHFGFVLSYCVDAVWFSRVCPYFRNLFHKMYIWQLKGYPDISEDANTSCILAYKWATSVLTARHAMSHDRRIYPIKYEDILAKPEDAVRRIFKRLNIDTDHVEQAVFSLSRDSQPGSLVGRNKLKTVSKREMSITDRINANAILSKYDLPCLGVDFRI